MTTRADIAIGVRAKHLDAAARRFMRLASQHNVLVIRGHQRSFLWKGEIKAVVKGKDADVAAFVQAVETMTDTINGVPS